MNNTEVATSIREYSESLRISFDIDEKTGRPILKVSCEPGYIPTTIDVLDILNYLKEHHPQILAAVTIVAWIRERQAVVDALHDLCKDFGDNDWPDSAHLGDVIGKHLAPHIHMACPIKKITPLFHELSGGICNRK